LIISWNRRVTGKITAKELLIGLIKLNNKIVNSKPHAANFLLLRCIQGINLYTIPTFSSFIKTVRL